MGWTNQGLGTNVTPYYSFQYDESLSTPEFNSIEPSRTLAVELAAGLDFKMMQDWFGGISLDVNLPITVNVSTASNSGNWAIPKHDPSVKGDLTITLNPGRGDQWTVRYILVAEMVEQFMRAMDLGWYGEGQEGSYGEGLSQFLAAQFALTWGDDAIKHLGTIPPPNFEYSNYWLASNRINYVKSPDGTDSSRSEKSACVLLFLYYLHDQLGYSVEKIIAAGAASLDIVYHHLTGKVDDPFPAFKQMLESAFPGNSIITTGRNLDNPFPLSSS